MRRTGIHANMHVNHNFANLILQVMEKTVAFVFCLISLQTSRIDSSDQKTVVLDVFVSFWEHLEIKNQYAFSSWSKNKFLLTKTFSELKLRQLLVREERMQTKHLFLCYLYDVMLSL